MLLLYFAGMTAIGAPPEYRYRMVLEPMLIVPIAQLLLWPGRRLLGMCFPRSAAEPIVAASDSKQY